MPVTPFHLGPVLLLGILVFPALYLPALLLGSVIPDIEAFLYLSHGVGSHPHGIMHTYLGGTVVGILLGLILYSFRKFTQRMMNSVRLGQNSSPARILASSILGVYSHVFLDSFLYTDIEPFFPSGFNPFYEMVGWGEVYILCTITLILGFFAYIYKSSKKNGL